MALLEITLPTTPLEIPENSTSGFPLGNIGLNLLGVPLVEVGLVGPDADRFSVVDLGNGVVQIVSNDNSAFDYEARGGQPIQVGLQANLLGIGVLESSLFTINLTDVNDNPPADVAFASGGSTLANAAPGTVIGTLTASDADTVGGPLTFSIVGGADAGLFTIGEDGTSLVLAPGQTLPAAGGTLDVVVRANDGLNNSVDTALAVNVVAVPPGSNPVPGGSGDDVLPGTPGDDVANGGDGDDTLQGSAGADILDGGNGNDTVDYSNSPAGVNVNLETGVGSGGDAEGDQYLGIENIIGSAFDDVLHGNGGANQIAGGDGFDTAVYDLPLSAFQVSDQGSSILITLDGVTDTLTGIEAIQFQDGTVRVDDGDPLFDPLYYYSTNYDVFAAGMDAKEHYDTFGFKEGRNPNPFFDTKGYLSANADIREAGMNPLEHFRIAGEAEHRDPSAAFDIDSYLAQNPDVAGAGIGALTHFLAAGQAEGRGYLPAIGAPHQINEVGFDSEFYLLSNPDVGNSEFDAFEHYLTFGAGEGRDPSAWFDTDFYLANNADVAASGMNPLEHYHQFGWREGRDPSAGFDTSLYLEAYADVAAAGIDPLQHFLAFGSHEGRMPQSSDLV